MVEVIEAKEGLDAFDSVGLFLVVNSLNLVWVDSHAFCANNKA